MKRLAMAVFQTVFISFIQTNSFAQDTMYKVSGEEVDVKVVEISQDNVRYRNFSNLNGPIYVVPIRDIFMIKYENGEEDVFGVKSEPVISSNQPTLKTSEVSFTVYDIAKYRTGGVVGVVLGSCGIPIGIGVFSNGVSTNSVGGQITGGAVVAVGSVLLGLGINYLVRSKKMKSQMDKMSAFRLTPDIFRVTSFEQSSLSNSTVMGLKLSCTF